MIGAIVASSLCVLAAAAAPDRGGTRIPVTPAGGGPLLLVEWASDGSAVAVGDRWLLDPASGKFRPRSAKGPLPPPALDGRAHQGKGGAVEVGFALSPGTTFTQRFAPAGTGATCRVRSGTGAAAPPRGGCLSPEFGYLAQVQVGPASLLALLSSAEGHAALQIVRYDPKQGQSDTRAPTLTIEGSGAVRVAFAPDGTSVTLVSPCELQTGRPPCAEPDQAAHWRQYQLPLDGRPPKLVRADLPPGAAFHPARKEYAWVAGGAACVGQPLSPRCWPLPGGKLRQ
jgi:hypothetical protein